MELSEKKYFDPPEDSYELEDARVVIASVPVEAMVSYGSGASLGPMAILEASQHVELFDAEELCEPYRAGIATLAVPPKFESATDALSYVKNATAEILETGKFPIIIGGDHSLTPGVLEAFAAKDTSFSVLHFDAHSDLRDSYHGDIHSHASALRRVCSLPAVKTIVQLGIRNISNDGADGSEFQFIQDNTDRIKVNFAKDMRLWKIETILDDLAHDVYITFDVDALDPSIMPSTGTPEPGGMDWYTILGILKEVCAKKNIIGMDMVELAPISGFHAPDFLVAKLIYKTIGFIGKTKGWIQ